jgi:4-diphosphocytidyl-2-C-methyl-D-erythritol kinase
MVHRSLTELAPAKVNLSLQVLGRRCDGYHELDSLVAFADGDASDRLTLVADVPDALAVSGLTSVQLDGGRNLVSIAIEAARRQWPHVRAGRFELEKRLPVAAGIGGGSSDAAAAIRLLQRLNPEIAGDLAWAEIAKSIGADVPVCLEPVAGRMTGIGAEVERLAAFPRLDAILVNPGVPLATAAVFKALDAPAVAGPPRRLVLPQLATADDVIEVLSSRPNDLQRVAVALCPAVADVLGVLARMEGAQVVRMSGSGPTCFALVDGADAARRGANRIAAAHPDWWGVATTLG